eukprot:06428.XXX_237077_243549_1 [CDS] Oithona nana genome sequencing.
MIRFGTNFILTMAILPYFVFGSIKPNYIIMNMDDLGWGDLGTFGHPSKETPRLDQMAKEGAILTDFYSAAAICSP